MHIDFPLYADHENQLYLARGKETSLEYVWEPADPDGLNDYFFAEFKDRAQLKRIVRYIKKWKQEKYNNSNNSHETPPSIGLTLLACNNYANYTYDGDDDLSSLYYTMKTIQEQFSVQRDINGEITSASIACNLPVTPFSDVFYKMRTSPQHMITLYNRIRNAVSNLCNAMNLEESHEAAKYVQKVLGDEFEIPAKQAKDAAAVVKREYNFGYGE